MAESEKKKQRGLIRKSCFSRSLLNGHRALRHHAILIGKLTFFWNSLHAELLELFVQIAGEKDSQGRIDRSIPCRVWHDQSNDSSQRALLLAFAELRLNSDPQLFELLKWIITELNALATYRNDAIHVAFELHTGPQKDETVSIPNARASQLNRISRLDNVGYRKLFRAAIHDIYRLGDMLWEINLRLKPYRPQDGKPLPEKPALRARALVEKSPPKTSARPESLKLPQPPLQSP